MESLFCDLDYKFLGVRQNFDVKIVITMRKTSYAIVKALTYCNLAITYQDKNYNKPKLFIRKFRYTLGAIKTKINIYININIKKQTQIWNVFFIFTFHTYKFRFYKRRYYIRFFIANNNISISVFPNRYGDFICGQLYTFYSESSLSPEFKRTQKDNENLYREIMAEY